MTIDESGQITTATLLIVDDDRDIREALAQAIHLEGIDLTVVSAADSTEGMRLALEVTPDVIIIDYNMPMVNGFAFADMIRADERLKRTKLIMLTAMDSKSMSWQSVEHHIDVFVGKPFDINDIEAHVYSLLSKTLEKRRSI